VYAWRLLNVDGFVATEACWLLQGSNLLQIAADEGVSVLNFKIKGAMHGPVADACSSILCCSAAQSQYEDPAFVC
jgi:hypothetical protein